MPREQSVRAVVSLLALALFASYAAARPPEAPKIGASILFADDRSRQRFDEYRAFLESDPTKFASQLATIRRLEYSDVQYVVAVSAPIGGGVEGILSTDGERVLIRVP